MRAVIQDNDFEEEEWDPEREVDDIWVKESRWVKMVLQLRSCNPKKFDT